LHQIESKVLYDRIQWAAGRATRKPPVIILTMPPTSNQMDLLVGEPVKNFEKPDAAEFEDWVPQIIRRIPTTNNAIPNALVIIVIIPVLETCHLRLAPFQPATAREIKAFHERILRALPSSAGWGASSQSKAKCGQPPFFSQFTAPHLRQNVEKIRLACRNRQYDFERNWHSYCNGRGVGKQFPIMNKLEFEGGWNILRGKLKQGVGKFGKNRLLLLEGQRDELTGRVQKRAGATLRALKSLKHRPDGKLV
jgi:uncharacterized protein YjbJ (UPF0337 family)